MPKNTIAKRPINIPKSRNKIRPQSPQTHGTVELQAYEHVKKFSGPLPPSDEYAAYEATSPGSATRILAMAEREQESRLKVTEQLTEAKIADTKAERQEIRRSQWLAWSLAMFVIGIGGWLVYTNHQIVGTLLTGGTLIGIVTAFLNQNTKKSKKSVSSTTDSGVSSTDTTNVEDNSRHINETKNSTKPDIVQD